MARRSAGGPIRLVGVGDPVRDSAFEGALLDKGAEMALRQVRRVHVQQQPQGLGGGRTAFVQDPPDRVSQRRLAGTITQREDLDAQILRERGEGVRARPGGRPGTGEGSAGAGEAVGSSGGPGEGAGSSGGRAEAADSSGGPGEAAGSPSAVGGGVPGAGRGPAPERGCSGAGGRSRGARSRSRRLGIRSASRPMPTSRSAERPSRRLPVARCVATSRPRLPGGNASRNHAPSRSAAPRSAWVTAAALRSVRAVRRSAGPVFVRSQPYTSRTPSAVYGAQSHRR